MESIKAEYVSHFGSDFFPKAFIALPCGASYLQLIIDDTGTPIDYITLDVNPAFLQLLETSKDKVIARRASEQLSTTELRYWLDIFSPVALGEGITRTTMYAHSKIRKFNVTAISPRKGFFCLFFSEVTPTRRNA